MRGIAAGRIAAGPRVSRRSGFTLVELLIALLLFALLSAAATAMLNFGVTARERSGQRLDELASITRARALMTADLGQAAPRLWRAENGVAQPAFQSAGGVDGAAGNQGESIILLSFVRRGWRNDGGARRASLQRVEYRRAGDRLERRAWARVDGGAPGVASVLFTGLTSVRLRFFADGDWRDRWNPLQPDALPEAVEITISGAGLPGLRQAFFVAPGGSS